MNRQNLCSCLAIYDWIGEIDTMQFHELARGFFEDNGVLPDVCATSQPDGGSRSTSYTVMENRLRSDPLPGTRDLSLYHTLPNYKQLVFGWDVMATLSSAMGKMMAFCCDQAIRGIQLDHFLPILDRISRRVPISYAIGYVRSFEFGPSAYASGMVVGFGYSMDEMAEADRIGAWFRERMEDNRHLIGYLRDVYPLNVISEPHLSQRVGGLPLADWIAQRAERGTLRPLGGGAMLWRIDEAHVDDVRAELIPSGLLIAYPQAG